MNYWDIQHRRYVDFRPRQAARGGVALTVPTNFGTIGLFNNSNQYALVLRYYSWSSNTASAEYGLGQTQSRLTGTPGTVNPMVTTESTPPGLVDFSDQANALTTDINGLTQTALITQYNIELPLGVILPGWSIYLTAAAKAKAVVGGFLWEWCDPDEL